MFMNFVEKNPEARKYILGRRRTHRCSTGPCMSGKLWESMDGWREGRTAEIKY